MPANNFNDAKGRAQGRLYTATARIREAIDLLNDDGEPEIARIQALREARDKIQRIARGLTPT